MSEKALNMLPEADLEAPGALPLSAQQAWGLRLAGALSNVPQRPCDSRPQTSTLPLSVALGVPGSAGKVQLWDRGVESGACPPSINR